MYMKFQCLLFSINTFISISEIQLPQVFISYRRLDEQKEFTEKFVQQLRNQSITVWFDDDGIVAGDWLVPTIRKNIENSDIVVCVLSDEFFKSEYCQNELACANRDKKRFFFIKWNDTKLPKDFMFTAGGIRYHTYKTENPDAELKKCVDEFMKVIERQ